MKERERERERHRERKRERERDKHINIQIYMYVYIYIYIFYLFIFLFLIYTHTYFLVLTDLYRNPLHASVYYGYMETEGWVLLGLSRARDPRAQRCRVWGTPAILGFWVQGPRLADPST